MTELMRGQTCPAKGDQIPDVGEFRIPFACYASAQGNGALLGPMRYADCHRAESAFPRGCGLRCLLLAATIRCWTFCHLREVRKRRAIFYSEIAAERADNPFDTPIK
jgi:hypothetical protein